MITLCNLQIWCDLSNEKVLFGKEILKLPPMPVNKNAMTRYKILDEMLSNRYHNYSLDDLTRGVNEALEEMGISAVSRRCIEKDIQYIENEGPFMVEIERYSAEGFKADTQKSYTKRCLRNEKININNYVSHYFISIIW